MPHEQLKQERELRIREKRIDLSTWVLNWLCLIALFGVIAMLYNTIDQIRRDLIVKPSDVQKELREMRKIMDRNHELILSKCVHDKMSLRNQ